MNHLPPFEDAMERIDIANRLRRLSREMTEGDPKTAGMLVLAAKMIERQPASSPVLVVLEEVAGVLDKSLGDSDLTYLATDEEVKEVAPVQWACSQINKLLQGQRGD